MELAMSHRDSDNRRSERSLRGSEWTAGVRLRVLVVALPGEARQQLLEPSEKPLGKVALCSQGVL